MSNVPNLDQIGEVTRNLIKGLGEVFKQAYTELQNVAKDETKINEHVPGEEDNQTTVTHESEEPPKKRAKK
jgi:hypothetical protein